MDRVAILAEKSIPTGGSIKGRQGNPAGLSSGPIGHCRQGINLVGSTVGRLLWFYCGHFRSDKVTGLPSPRAVEANIQNPLFFARVSMDTQRPVIVVAQGVAHELETRHGSHGV